MNLKKRVTSGEEEVLDSDEEHRVREDEKVARWREEQRHEREFRVDLGRVSGWSGSGAAHYFST